VDPNQLSKSVIIISDAPPLTTQDGYINNAFEDGPQKADKVNDKHNVRINIKHHLHSSTQDSIILRIYLNRAIEVFISEEFINK